MIDRVPTEDEINRLEKAAWDARVDHVLVWYRDRIEAQEKALDAAWQDIQDWCKTARGLRERSTAPKGPDYDPACPSAAGIEQSEAVLRRISKAASLPPSVGRPQPQVQEQKEDTRVSGSDAVGRQDLPREGD